MFKYSAKVIHVIDGDTLDVQIDLGFDIHHLVRIRLFGINTPESRTRNKEEKRLGLAAKARLEELVAGKTIVVETKKDATEKYGRYLGVVFLGDKSINTQLIEEGHATEYFGSKR